MRRIKIVPLSKTEEMRKYFNEYLMELSQFDPDIEFNKKGIPIYNWFDCYWNDKNRFPIYFLVENEIAGLAMIRELGNMLYNFAEFYVCPKFRKDNNALWFANEITNLFDGQFVFSTRFTNPRAIKFWGKFALQFENSSYEDDEIWRNWTIRKTSFKNHTLNLNPIYFDLIKDKEKILEGRLNDEKRKTFQIGDIITFYKLPKKTETINAIILNKFIYKSFDEMADDLDKKDLGFDSATKEEMVKVYRTIYTREDEDKYGVVIFKIKVLS